MHANSLWSTIMSNNQPKMESMPMRNFNLIDVTTRDVRDWCWWIQIPDEPLGTANWPQLNQIFVLDCWYHNQRGNLNALAVVCRPVCEEIFDENLLPNLAVMVALYVWWCPWEVMWVIFSQCQKKKIRRSWCLFWSVLNSCTTFTSHFRTFTSHFRSFVNSCAFKRRLKSFKNANNLKEY